VSAPGARRRRTAAGAAVVVLACIVGSLGGTASAQTVPNACELFTQKDAKKILGKTVRRETNLAGIEATSCSYAVARDAKRVVGLGVGAFISADEAANAYARARATAQFDDLKIENVRNLGDAAYYLPKTNNFARTVREKKLVFGELTAVDGQDVYTAYLTPPSKGRARDVIEQAIERRAS
jgi:hypothetical protein